MIKKSQDLTLKDKLSRLTYLQACKLLGDNGQQILQQGGQLGIDIEMQVRFSEECFELRLLDEADRVVTITLSDDAQRRLQLSGRQRRTASPSGPRSPWFWRKKSPWG